MKKNLIFFWEIVPGNYCNLHCKNCYAAANARPDQRLLDKNNMRIALDKAIKTGMKTIDILGGEPLMYPHLEEFINYFHENSQDSFCGIVSNGTLITKKRAGLLAKCGVNQISISLDGTTAKTHNANRGKGAFSKALKGIKNIVEAKIPLTIAYTITQFNLLDIYNIFPFAKKLGAKAVGVQITEPFGRAKALEKSGWFNRTKGLKAICQIYNTRPVLYTEVSSRSLFQEFLNRFFNAGLTINPKKCDGGLKTFMVSSGGDLYPCSEYAYFYNGKQKNKGVNLVTDNLKVIEKYIDGKYAKFNFRQRSKADEKFTTCKICKYQNSCSPCPIINPPGKVAECEWVRGNTKKIINIILKSKIKLLINPVEDENNKIKFPVITQKQPLRVSISKKSFMRLISSQSIAQIIKDRTNNRNRQEDTRDKIIEFLCKLRSYHIIEIEGLKKFLEINEITNSKE